MLQEFEAAFGDVIKTALGQNALVISLFVILFFVLVIVFTGLDLTVGLLILIPLIVFLVAYQGFPEWILFVIVIGMALVYYLALRQLLNK